MSFIPDKKKDPGKAVLIAWLVAGTLDIAAASIQFYLRTGKGPAPVLRYIASAFFGPEALKGGTTMAATGLLFHYIIAFLFTLFFFWLYPRVGIARKNIFVSGLLYGVFVWIIMNLVIVPMSRVPTADWTFKKVSISMLILMFCIGLPIALICARYYKAAKKTN
jgi:hypothetical protein